MKHIIQILLGTVFALLITAGCTRNNGDIGKIFGRWTLRSVQTQNCPEPIYEGDLFLSFQSDVVQMLQNIGDNQTSVSYGSYRLDDNTLFLDFSDPKHPVLPAFGLPEQSRLQVAGLTSKEMILIYHPTDDSSVQYNFRKW